MARRRACVAAANGTLERTGDEGRAVAACIAAMGRVGESGLNPEREFKREEPTGRVEYLVVPIAGLKADAPTGTIEGHGSIFGNVDDQGDIVVKGAFKRTLSEMKASGRKLKMLWRHRDPIGVWSEAREDRDGLFVSGRPLVEDVQLAREAVALARSGAVDEMSIGYVAKESELSRDGMVRKLLDVDLREVSLVPFAANPLARVTAVKEALVALSTVEELEEALKEGRPMTPELAAVLARAAWPAVCSPSEADLGDVSGSLKRLVAILRS